MTAPLTDDARRDHALKLLDQIRAELENDQIENSILQLDTLRQHMQQWRDKRHLEDAKTWLNDALQDDVLAFNADLAQQHLTRWRAIKADDEQLQDYEKRVATAIEKRTTALKIRGVIAFCDELLKRAQELEQQTDPPDPDFIIQQYYRKANGIAEAALQEQSDHEDLEILVRRTQRIYEQKLIAASIYAMVLEDQKFTGALNNLDGLPDHNPIPRFTRHEDLPGQHNLRFHSMIPLEQARGEIRHLAQEHAINITQKAIQTAQQQLEAYNPDTALETLDLSENLRRFLPDEISETFKQIRSQAQTDSESKARAEAQAEQARQMAVDNPPVAWDHYARAYHLYRWVDGLREIREIILKTLQKQLKQQLTEAENAFNAHQMDRVQEMVADAQHMYQNKDTSLDDLLTQFAELNQMVGRYRELLAQGQQTIESVRRMIQQDTIGASELLGQVEGYPELVLEALPDVQTLRQHINHRLAADHTYNQLYQRLFFEDTRLINDAIQETNRAITDYSDDKRFPVLERALRLHLDFLNARGQAATKPQQTRDTITPLLSMPEHPDHEAARALMAQIEASSTNNT